MPSNFNMQIKHTPMLQNAARVELTLDEVISKDIKFPISQFIKFLPCSICLAIITVLKWWTMQPQRTGLTLYRAQNLLHKQPKCEKGAPWHSFPCIRSLCMIPCPSSFQIYSQCVVSAVTLVLPTGHIQQHQKPLDERNCSP